MFYDSYKSYEKLYYEDLYLITLHIFSLYSLEKLNIELNCLLNQPVNINNYVTGKDS